ncbi:hypothetical protein EFA59_00940 [Weissella hellenica]|jgi:multiple sugar transport system substrate-binding protein|nr:hypothetical protein EFA59_00940 [Weissella hellenica]
MQQSFLLTNKVEQDSMTIFNYRYNGYLADYLDRYAYDAVFNKTSVSQYLKKMQNTVQDEVDAQMTN